jgi:hypothetical protein
LVKGAAPIPAATAIPIDVIMSQSALRTLSRATTRTIMLGKGNPVRAYWANYVTFIRSGPSASLRYMDYNVYDRIPRYSFTHDVLFNLSQTRSQGFERHASVVSASSIFVDRVYYVLRPRWTTAGRYGDPMGRRYPVAQILNTSRYGPGALNIGTSPSTTQQPQNQTISAGGTATFPVQVNGSGLLYQWQKSNAGTGSWVNFQGANSAMLTFPSVSTPDHGARFRCLVSHGGGSVWSDLAELTVRAAAAAPPVGVQPSSRRGTVRPEGSQPVDRPSRGDLE